MFQFTHLSYPDRTRLADALAAFDGASPVQRLWASHRLALAAKAILGSDQVTASLLSNTSMGSSPSPKVQPTEVKTGEVVDIASPVTLSSLTAGDASASPALLEVI